MREYRVTIIIESEEESHTTGYLVEADSFDEAVEMVEEELGI